MRVIVKQTVKATCSVDSILSQRKQVTLTRYHSFQRGQLSTKWEPVHPGRTASCMKRQSPVPDASAANPGDPGTDNGFQ